MSKQPKYKQDRPVDDTILDVERQKDKPIKLRIDEIIDENDDYHRGRITMLREIKELINKLNI